MVFSGLDHYTAQNGFEKEAVTLFSSVSMQGRIVREEKDATNYYSSIVG